MENLSIHPRSWRGVDGFGEGTNNKKSNTAKPRGARARTFDRKLRRLNSRRTDHQLTVRGVKNASAYKVPGSMND